MINAATGRNNTTEVKIDRFVLDESYDSGFALALMEKDVSIAATLMAAARRTLPGRCWRRDGWPGCGADADHTDLPRRHPGRRGVETPRPR